MSSLLRSLAAATTRRPRVSIAVLLLLLVAAIGAATSAGGRYVDDFSVPGIESQQAQDLIEQRFPRQGGDAATVVLTAKAGTLRDARSAIGATMRRIERQPHVSAVAGPLSPGHLAGDGRTAFATVDYDADAADLGAAPRERLEAATASLSGAGVAVAMSGPVIDAGNEGRLPAGELAGVLAAVVLLLVVLRSARAAFASLFTALLGVGLGFALLG